MRWFFLLVLLLFAVVCNAAVFEVMNSSRLLAGVSLNLILCGLGCIWWSAYWLSESRRNSGLKYSMSIILLGLSMALGQYSLEHILANECPAVRNSGRAKLLAVLFKELVEAGHCKLVLGAYLAGSATLLFGSVQTFHRARQGQR